MFCFKLMVKGRGLNLMLKLGIHIAVKCNCSHRKLALNTSVGVIFLVDYLPAHRYLYNLITPVKVTKHHR